MRQHKMAKRQHCYGEFTNLNKLNDIKERMTFIMETNNNQVQLHRFCTKFFTVAETTAELHVSGTRKTSSNLARRSHIFVNKINPETRLPSIKDTSDHQSVISNGQSRSRSRSKTPITASPKSTRLGTRGNVSRQASISSIFNTLKQHSTENFDYHQQMDNNNEEDDDEFIGNNRLRRKSNESAKYSSTKAQQKSATIKNNNGNNNDSGVDIRFSSSSGDTQQQKQQQQQQLQQQQQQQSLQTKVVEISKEKSNQGQLYQRRTNNTVKAPIKQKIDKLRRRSEEATQALNGMVSNTISTGLSIHTTSPHGQQQYVITPSYQHSRKQTTNRASPHHMSGPTNVRRVSSEAEIQQRLQALRLSADSNLIHDMNNPHSSYSRDATITNSRRGDRSKSPFQFSQQQQPSQPSSPYNRHRQSPVNQHLVQLRHPHTTERGYIQPPTSSNLLSVNNITNGSVGLLNSAQSFKHHHSSHKENNNNNNNPNSNSGSLYLAFIASRHLSTLEDTLFEFDIDHQKLLRIFTWLKNVEDYRHEQMDHDKLIIEQNERMLHEEENLSLYSEIQYAVDDLPANLTGKAGEKIPTMKYAD
ncbi:unnamed protein product [Didymodactylos carnosus]|uniref:Uncharacterized protein n=1 Tax=Didymodactylos carnosus TaxID=1234261 RepID=A0A814PQS9_9BILA|nr:unnamed protein product [Didymodactylos carnosus]CAF1109415.1 unnamed protein product [Didymodactylos carnosus]CAF3674143.1 unnamed protein product [Didymodactylos carnosus]CAF3873851.1 unnamed protein product [Didymodactylos carnosus]